ncbi:MAG: nitroreductase family protein [Bacilli bacterium]|nr:nitroreductase family protein [Bacilli bacterium]
MQEQIHKEVAQSRHAEHPIDPIFLNRWSPRAFSEQEIPEDVLLSIFEAARWAPSASNEQPWRYIVAANQTERERFHTFISPFNLEWCKKPPVLVLAISKKTGANDKFNRTHAFDAGTAWGYLALEAIRLGLFTHGMGGFDADKARETLQIPEDYDLHAVIAIGYRGETSSLPERYQERETPSNRRQTSETIVSFLD